MKYLLKPEDYKGLKKTCAILVTVFAVIGMLFYFVAGNSLFYTRSETTMPNRASVTEYLPSQTKIIQAFAAQADQVESVILYVTTRGHERNTDVLNVSIFDQSGRLLSTAKADTSRMQNYANFTVRFEEPAKTHKGETYFLVIESESGEEANSISLYYGEVRGYSRYKVDKEIASESLLFGGRELDGSLCVSFVNIKNHWVGRYYWIGYVLSLLVLCGYISILLKKARNQKITKPIRFYLDLKRYWFLITQLVNRDFKAKYKRSVLGILWSFLNPLLTMMVQYVVFSTLFKSDTPNYVVYLFTGIICFNYVNEACNMSLSSIVGNTALITKVYVPKYLYPMTRVVTSTINLLLSLIPLMAAVLITGLPVRLSFILIVFDIVCMFLFSLGMGLILSTMMVYFRDTQFLWNVFSLLWCYLTPCFYTISILPSKLFPWYFFNPLLHYVNFLRTILIDGVSPEPMQYLICLGSALLVYSIGRSVFKKYENDFVLHL